MGMVQNLDILEILVRIVAAVATMGAGYLISTYCMARFIKSCKRAIGARGEADAGTGELPEVGESSDAEDARNALASISARVDWKALLLSASALGAAWICAGAVLRFPIWAVVLSSAIPVHVNFNASRMFFPSLFNAVLEFMYLALIAIASLVTGIAVLLIGY